MEDIHEADRNKIKKSKSRKRLKKQQQKNEWTFHETIKARLKLIYIHFQTRNK